MADCPVCGSSLANQATACPKCGARASDTEPPAAQPTGPTRAPSNPRGRTAWIALILASAVVVAGLGVWYWATGGTLLPGRGDWPEVTLTAAQVQSTGTAIGISTISRDETPTKFRVNLAYGPDGGTSQAMPTMNGYGYRVTVPTRSVSFFVAWIDDDQDGNLSRGDYFALYFNAGIADLPAQVTFSLLWTDNSTVASRTFTWTDLRPTIRFHDPQAYAMDSMSFTVEYAQPTRAGAKFKVNLMVNEALGIAQGIPAQGGMVCSMDIGGATYKFDWIDAVADGGVGVGDSFRITVTGGSFPYGMASNFYLIWAADGTVAANAVFTWTALSMPQVRLGPAGVVGPTTWRTVVFDAQPSMGPANYRLGLTAGGSVSGSVPMPTTDGASASLNAGGWTFGVQWNDTGGDGLVDTGDSFVISLTGGPALATGTEIQFRVKWTDDTVLASVTWQA